jgi:hypothetical protein
MEQAPVSDIHGKAIVHITHVLVPRYEHHSRTGPQCCGLQLLRLRLCFRVSSLFAERSSFHIFYHPSTPPAEHLIVSLPHALWNGLVLQLQMRTCAEVSVDEGVCTMRFTHKGRIELLCNPLHAIGVLSCIVELSIAFNIVGVLHARSLTLKYIAAPCYDPVMF